MAEAGSFAEKVKQQADIVRVVGEYVRLKKAGKDFSGLCPFHQEKTPSFTVSPIKQIFYCFGCGKGGDVFNFVMEMERCEFPAALRIVAEKCGISIPKRSSALPEDRKRNKSRTLLLEAHRDAQTFFVNQLQGTAEGKLAQAYLEDRGLRKETIERFGIGYAPSGGDLLLRHLRGRYSDDLLSESGLVSKSENGRLFDRFRQRIAFPIANESGKTVAFGCRALGDDKPKYLNSPETPIYSKSRVLYNLNRVRDSLQKANIKYEARLVVLVEGYMDCIRVDSEGWPYAVASCGTSLTDLHAELLRRVAPRVVVWYDSDSAGQAATDRSIDVLLGQELEIGVYHYTAHPGADPDTYVKEVGAGSAFAPIHSPFQRLVHDLSVESLREQQQEELRRFNSPFFEERLKKEAELRAKLEEAKSRAPGTNAGGSTPLYSYNDFLMNRAKSRFDISTSEGKLGAVNFLLPYVQKIPNRILRSEWATRIAQQLRLDEPVLRAALSKAATERRSEVKTQPELLGRAAKPVERRLIRMLAEAEGFRHELAQQLQSARLYHGLETERIFAALIVASLSGQPLQATEVAAVLEERDRRLLFEILFEEANEPTWEEAVSCIEALQHRQAERELADVQRSIEANPAAPELRGLLEKKQELMRRLAAAR